MSWATPRVFARCTGCGAQFDGTRAEIAREVKGHRSLWSELPTPHTSEWVGVCGCGREFAAATQAAAVKLLKAHAAVRDYEPVELFGNGGAL